MTVPKRPKQLRSDDVNWEAFKNSGNINLRKIHNNMYNYNLQSQDGLNEVFDQIENAIYNTALQCRIPKNLNPEEAPENYVQLTDANTISERITQKEIQKWNNILACNDSKQLWKEIEWKEKSGIESIKYPSAEKLGNHFKGKSTIVESEYFVPNSNPTFVPSLDMPISLQEISAASKRLKDNKTSADGWTPRMVTTISGTLFNILFVLFNIILQCALYPTRWRTSMVAAIFKNKGSHLIAKFYRPVSIVVLLSKLFDFILLKRFQNWFLPHDSQSAYQSGKSCAEHVCLFDSSFNTTQYQIETETFYSVC